VASVWHATMRLESRFLRRVSGVDSRRALTATAHRHPSPIALLNHAVRSFFARSPTATESAAPRLVTTPRPRNSPATRTRGRQKISFSERVPRFARVSLAESERGRFAALLVFDDHPPPFPTLERRSNSEETHSRAPPEHG
jgi:hypothetical protein